MAEAGWASLVEHVIWPVTVVVLVLVLRRPIGDFLSAIGGRVTRVSVMAVRVDLAVATETVPPWRGMGGEDVRGLVVADLVSDSYFDTLRQALQFPGTADFFLVDLKADGRHEWLTSRLYLFTYVLGKMKGVRSVVFTATRGDVGRSFLAVAGAEDLLRALETTEPWLRLARLLAEGEKVGWLPTMVEMPQLPSPATPAAPAAPLVTVSVPEDIDEWWRSAHADPLGVSQQFLLHVQWVQPEGTADPSVGWLKLPDFPGRNKTWEHARWIAASDLADGVLRNAVQPDSYVLDDRSWSAEERVRAVVQAHGDFVALLGPRHRFERLIDRRSMLEAVGMTTFNPS
jgi:hypothetical protein